MMMMVKMKIFMTMKTKKINLKFIDKKVIFLKKRMRKWRMMMKKRKKKY